MEHFALTYIRKKMRDKGYSRYHIESYSFMTDGNQTEYLITAYNEFYYLVSQDLLGNTLIHSDSNIYPVNSMYPQQKVSQVQEFTGLIIIENPNQAVQLLEFIRIIPEL